MGLHPSLLSSKPNAPVSLQLCSTPAVASLSSLPLSLADHLDFLQFFPHSSCHPNPQFQQEFFGNPPAKLAREGSRPSKKAGELHIFILPSILLIWSPLSYLTPNRLHTVVFLYFLFSSPENQAYPGRTTYCPPSCNPPNIPQPNS